MDRGGSIEEMADRSSWEAVEDGVQADVVLPSPALIGFPSFRQMRALV